MLITVAGREELETGVEITEEVAVVMKVDSRV